MGVVLHADTSGTSGTTGGFSEVHRGAPGDPRGSSANALTDEFLGDYVYAIGARTYGAGVWTDVPHTVDCPAMDAWRQASFNAGHHVFPAPWPLGDCPAHFANSDIHSATTAP